MVGCKGGSRYVEGVRGFLVSWFSVVGFLNFKIVGFLASKFLVFKVSKFERFNDRILPNVHCMFSGRY